jgi:hypothetical protein
MTGQSTLVDKPGRTRRYHVPPDAARTIAALLTLRDQVIAPIIAGVRSPRMGRKAMTWTPVDRDYETLRIDLQTLFTHLGITTTQQPRHTQRRLLLPRPPHRRRNRPPAIHDNSFRSECAGISRAR